MINSFSSMDPISMMLFLAMLSMIPLGVMITTCFLKFVIVLTLTRNAMGVQQVPPTMVLQAIALCLTIFVMSPTLQKIGERVTNQASSSELSGLSPVDVSGLNQVPSQPSLPKVNSGQPMGEQFKKIVYYLEPLRDFMKKHVNPTQTIYFLDSAKRIWPPDVAKEAKATDFVILIPSFVVSEMQKGFEIGFLIFLPFVIIDLIMSNILMALGMQQVSPNTVSLPLKILLFVAVDGWGKLLQNLVSSYI
jgi:type III secretion protein R